MAPQTLKIHLREFKRPLRRCQGFLIGALLALAVALVVLGINRALAPLRSSTEHEANWTPTTIAGPPIRTVAIDGLTTAYLQPRGRHINSVTSDVLVGVMNTIPNSVQAAPTGINSERALSRRNALGLKLHQPTVTTTTTTIFATVTQAVQLSRSDTAHRTQPTTFSASMTRSEEVKVGPVPPEKRLDIIPEASEEPKVPPTAAPADGIVAPGPQAAAPHEQPGTFEIVGDTGVPAMHAAELPNGRILYLDKVEDVTHLKLENGQYAYSSEYDPITNETTPLRYKTNAFCAGGAFLRNGTLISLGGNGELPHVDPTVRDGFRGIRYLSRSANDPSMDGKDWIEPGHKLDTPRWYPSVQILPDGTFIVVAGSLNALDPTNPANNNPTFEMLDQEGYNIRKSIKMDILVRNYPWYMYPILHMLPNGDVFIMAGKESQIFNFKNNSVVRDLPDMPGMSRTYPTAGGSVMLTLSSKNNWEPTILVCGGGAYQDITSPTDASCGIIKPLAADPQWTMFAMPQPRVMVECLNLPNGKVLCLNGGSSGAEGFGLAKDPALQALIWDPSDESFKTAGTSTIPRLYHSVAVLKLDGTVDVAGSNPNEQPILIADASHPFQTEFRHESYVPPCLQGENAKLRPLEVHLSTLSLRADGHQFDVEFRTPGEAKFFKIVLFNGGFSTHARHMGARTIELDVESIAPEFSGSEHFRIRASMPANAAVVPPGPYKLFVVVDDVPSVGQYVMVG